MEKKATPLPQTYIYFHRWCGFASLLCYHDLPCTKGIIIISLKPTKNGLEDRKDLQWFGDFENVGKGFPKQQHVFFWLPIIAFFWGWMCHIHPRNCVHIPLPATWERSYPRTKTKWWESSFTWNTCNVFFELYIIFTKIHVNTTTMQLWMGYYHVRKSKGFVKPRAQPLHERCICSLWPNSWWEKSCK